MTAIRDPNDPAEIDPKIAQNALQVDPMLREGRRGAGSTLMIVGFLAVVIAITAVAISSHHQEPGQAAIDAPPGAPGTPTAQTTGTGAAMTTGTATPASPAMPSGRSDSAATPGAQPVNRGTQ